MLFIVAACRARNNRQNKMVWQGNISNSESPILIKFGMNVVFEKIFDPYFFLSAMVDVKGVKTTLKVGGLKHILLNISEIIEDIVFV